MPANGARRRRARPRQKVTPPKVRKGVAPMTKKERNNSSAAMLSNDLYGSWRNGMKQVVASYLDTNEKLAKETLGWYEKATAWTKDTPWEPLIKMQISSTSK